MSENPPEREAQPQSSSRAEDQPAASADGHTSPAAERRRWFLPGGFGSVATALILLALVSIVCVVLLERATERRLVAGVRADMRQLATAVESYYVDFMTYPDFSRDRLRSADSFGFTFPAAHPPTVTWRARSRDPAIQPPEEGATLTTPIAYIPSYPKDVFADTRGTTFRYYSDVNGWIMGSWGPDHDQSTGGDLAWHLGPYPRPPMPVQPPPRNPMRDGVQAIYSSLVAQPTPRLLAGSRGAGVEACTYDATNGLHSPGDIWRVKQ